MHICQHFVTVCPDLGLDTPIYSGEMEASIGSFADIASMTPGSEPNAALAAIIGFAA